MTDQDDQSRGEDQSASSWQPPTPPTTADAPWSDEEDVQTQLRSTRFQAPEPPLTTPTDLPPAPPADLPAAGPTELPSAPPADLPAADQPAVDHAPAPIHYGSRFESSSQPPSPAAELKPDQPALAPTVAPTQPSTEPAQPTAAPMAAAQPAMAPIAPAAAAPTQPAMAPSLPGPPPTMPIPPTASGPKEIATLPPLDELIPHIPISEATGQPPRDRVMLIGMGLLYAAAAISVVAFVLMWWRAINIATYFESARLVGWLNERPGSWQSVVLAIGTALISLVTVTAPAVSGFQAWNGHKWSRIAAAVAAGLSLLAILLNTLALVAIPFAIAGAAVLWLPRVTTYFGHWAAFRAPAQKNPIDVSSVVYGPLPRYR